MSKWKVLKFRRANGECPVDDFLDSSQVASRDRSKIDDRIRMIQQLEQPELPSNWVVNYQSTALQRLERKAPNNKAFRFLCEKDQETKTIVLFNGVLKKEKNLPAATVAEAQTLQQEYRLGHGSVENYSFD